MERRLDHLRTVNDGPVAVLLSCEFPDRARWSAHDVQSGRSTQHQLFRALSIYRIVFDFLYVVHGAPKLFAWPVDTGTVPVGT